MSVKQYILPLIPLASGRYAEIRFNVRSYRPYDYDRTTSLPAKNRDFYAGTANTVFLDRALLSYNGTSPLRMHMSAQEGQVTPDTRDFEFIDQASWTGKLADGTVVTGTQSLRETLFWDAKALTTIHISERMLDTLGDWDAGTTYSAGDVVLYDGDAWEARGTLVGVAPGGAWREEVTFGWVLARHKYFEGDIKNSQVISSEVSVHRYPDAADTLNATIREHIVRGFKFSADNCLNRTSAHKIEDLFEVISSSDLVTSEAAYGGFIAGPGENGLPPGWSFSLLGFLNLKATFGADLKIAGTSINDGLSYINVSTLFAKLCAVCDFEFNSTTDLTTGMQYYIDKASVDATGTSVVIGSSNVNENAHYGAGNIFDRLYFCYDYFVNSNPLCDLHVAEMSNSFGYEWQAELAEPIGKFARQFVQWVRSDYNQTTKKLIFRMMNRRDLAGDPIPPQLKLGKDSKSTPRSISATHVEVKNRNYNDKVACPNRRGKGIELEIPFATKLRGRNGPVKMDDMNYNESVPPNEQISCWTPFVGGTKRGGHIVRDDATITFISPIAGVRLYSVTSTTIDARRLEADDPVGFVGFSGYTVQSVTNRHSFIVQGAATLTTGTNKSFAAGYSIIGEAGIVATLDTTTFQGEVDFADYIGHTLYVPARGIFQIIDATTISGVHFCTVDGPLGAAASGLKYRISGETPIQINSNGWLQASFLYVRETDTTANYLTTDLNGLLDAESPYGDTDSDWSGFYTVNRCIFGYPDASDHDVPPDYTFGNTLAGPARAWAAELIGDFSSKDREYVGCRGANGYVTDLQLLCTDITIEDCDVIVSGATGVTNSTETFTDAGAAFTSDLIGKSIVIPAYSTLATGNVFTITAVPSATSLTLDTAMTASDTNLTYHIGGATHWRAIGIDINEFNKPSELTKISWVEQPVNPSGAIDPKLFPIISLGQGGASGNAASVGAGGGSGMGGGGGTVDLGNAVITKPNTAKRNRIYSQGDTIPELEGVRSSATSTADHISFYNEDGTTKTFSVDKDGAVTAASGTLNGALDMTTHQIHNVVDPTADQDAATKKYVDDGIAGVSGFVTKTPNATTSLNNVVDQTATTVGLSIEKHASQSANVTEWRDASHTAQTWIDSALEFRTNGTIHVGTNVEATFSINAGSKVTSSATVTGDPAQVCTTKDWVVTLKPDTSNTNIIQATDNSTNPLVIKAKSGSGQDLLRFHDSSASLLTAFDSTGGLHVTGGGTVSVTNATGNAFGSSSSAGAGSFSATNASTAAGAVTIFEIINNGASARGAVSINSNGTTQFGPLDNNTVLTKGIGVSGNFSQPFKEVNANTTLDGTYQFVRADTSGGNVTITLPAHAKGTWFMIQKKSALNTLNINNSTGTLQRAVTANGAATWMYSDGSAWAWYTPT